MKTIYLRDTDYSFIKTTTNENNEVFNRKIEKGNVDYSNACALFHSRNVEIKIGNKVEK